MKKKLFFILKASILSHFIGKMVESTNGIIQSLNRMCENRCCKSAQVHKTIIPLNIRHSHEYQYKNPSECFEFKRSI